MDIKVFLRYKNLFVSLVIVIIAAVLAQVLFSYYSLQEDNIDAKLQELVVGEQTIARWQELKLENEEVKSLFFAKDTLFFKKFVEEKANSLGIRITFLNTSDIEKDLYWEVTMQLGMACVYKDFISFIRDIEQKSITVEDIKIVYNAESGSEKINLNLKGFIIK
ncbi:MAG: hypothetical protein KAS05_02935 [Candidatus Omnitrophica bacterium]|nr:hypothetical protein [Candidatus Omnitrophota bacterium]